MRQTTRQWLQSPRDAPLISGTDGESLNPPSIDTCSKVNSPTEDSKLLSHCVSGCNANSIDFGSMSPKHSVFVLDRNGEPLTPTKPSKARKLLAGGVALPVWNKLGQMGIQMLVDTRKETPKTVLGVDFGTKFEGYSVVTGNENNLSVMWKLPDKKKIVAKLEERKILRRARRHRNCRRRECRADNRVKKNFIAPSQLVMVQSRMKCMAEFFKCYPIDTVALEDVCFNHRDKRWGKNFSTVEVGKNYVYGWLRNQADLHLFTGYDTQHYREMYGYTKTNNKSAENFNAHCSDALSLAVACSVQCHVSHGEFIVVDDRYRPVRRKLHDTQYSKGGVRYKYSTGSFNGVRKGTVCEHGQICGGTKNNYFIRNVDNKRISRTNLFQLSHRFKINGGWQFLPTLSDGVSLPMKDDCVCDYGDCACMDRYTGDSLYIDCSNTTVESLVSVLHDCDYGWNMSGDAWQKP